MADHEIGTIYALKVSEDRAGDISSSLAKGIGRFGWSYVETADLRELRRRIEEKGSHDLNEQEKNCYMSFLLGFEDGDYVVYINVPSHGQCTLARVTNGYFWEWADRDFNHRFRVDAESVRAFDRNDKAVHPLLSARLKLRGRWWRIYAKDEFRALLDAIKSERVGKGLTTEEDRIEQLAGEIQPVLLDVTEAIHRTHPRKTLEEFFQEVFRRMPGVVDVQRKQGRADQGADIIVVFEQRDPFTGIVQQKQYVVQVKSYEREHEDPQAVDDIKRALDVYQADAGLIVSTASSVGPGFEQALDELREDSKKEVDVLMGARLAAFVLRYGGELIDRFL